MQELGGKGCQGCGSVTGGPFYCGWCAAPFPQLRAPSKLGEERRSKAVLREEWLRKEYSTGTGEQNEKLLERLMDFLREDGVGEPCPQAASPQDIIRFLQVLDETGRTVVHESCCIQWGVKVGCTCACPRRAAAASVANRRLALQGVFKGRGLSDVWCRRTQSGNPCLDHSVSEYVDEVEREQCDAGVQVTQAPLVDVSVFHRIMATVHSDWAAAKRTGALVAGAMAARDGLFYTLLWCSGFRASDGLKLGVAQLAPFPARQEGGVWKAGGVTVDVTLAKTVGSLGQAYKVDLEDELDPQAERFTFSAAWALYQAALDDLQVLPAHRAGPVFRTIKQGDDGVVVMGPRCTWASMASRYTACLLRAGFGEEHLRAFALHSFHGSRPAREKAAGIPKAVTCEKMHWSEQMYDLYTKDRTMLSMESIKVAGLAGAGAAGATA